MELKELYFKIDKEDVKRALFCFNQIRQYEECMRTSPYREDKEYYRMKLQKQTELYFSYINDLEIKYIPREVLALRPPEFRTRIHSTTNLLEFPVLEKPLETIDNHSS